MQRFFTILLTSYLLICQSNNALGAIQSKPPLNANAPTSQHAYDVTKLLGIDQPINERSIPSVVLNNILLNMSNLGAVPFNETQTIAINYRFIPALIPCICVENVRNAVYYLHDHERVERRLEWNRPYYDHSYHNHSLAHYKVVRVCFKTPFILSSQTAYSNYDEDKFDLPEITHHIRKYPEFSFVLFYSLEKVSGYRAPQICHPIKAHVSIAHKTKIETLTPEQRIFICDLFDTQYLVLDRNTKPAPTKEEFPYFRSHRIKNTIIHLTFDQERILYSLHPELRRNLYLNYDFAVAPERQAAIRHDMISVYPKELSAAIAPAVKETLTKTECERLAQLSMVQLKFIARLAPNMDLNSWREFDRGIGMIDWRRPPSPNDQFPSLYDFRALPEDMQRNIDHCYRIIIERFARYPSRLERLLLHWDRKKIVRVGKIAAAIGFCYCLRRAWQHPYVRMYLKIPQR